MANRGMILGELIKTHCGYSPQSPPPGSTHREQVERLSPSLSQKQAHLHTLRTAASRLIFKQPAARYWLRSSPLGYRQVLAHPPLLEMAKNKGSLDNDKSLRKTPRVWTRLNDSSSPTRHHFIKKWLFNLMYINQYHRDQRKLKKQRNVFQTKEQIKTLQIYFNERRCVLPNREVKIVVI